MSQKRKIKRNTEQRAQLDMQTINYILFERLMELCFYAAGGSPEESQAIYGEIMDKLKIDYIDGKVKL